MDCSEAIRAPQRAQIQGRGQDPVRTPQAAARSRDVRAQRRQQPPVGVFYRGERGGKGRADGRPPRQPDARHRLARHRGVREAGAAAQL